MAGYWPSSLFGGAFEKSCGLFAVLAIPPCFSSKQGTLLTREKNKNLPSE